MLDACRPARQSASGALCDRRKSPDLDIAGTLAENTASLRAVPETMARRGLKASPLTGSVFEEGKGAGKVPCVPYGLSKSVTAAVFRHRCAEFGVPLGKFVVPNCSSHSRKPCSTPTSCGRARRRDGQGRHALYVREKHPSSLR
jgi:hypothetical protein